MVTKGAARDENMLIVASKHADERVARAAMGAKLCITCFLTSLPLHPLAFANLWSPVRFSFIRSGPGGCAA